MATTNKFEQNRRLFPDAPVLASKKTYAPTYYTDPNDPYAINSFADVLFNNKALEKNYGSVMKAPLGDVAGRVVAAADLLYQGTLKPIINSTKYGLRTGGMSGALKGAGSGLTQAGLNALTNISETADIFANPVKAVAIEGSKALSLGDFGSKTGGDVWKGVTSSLGMGDQGRYQYDWDTGNTIADIGLELVSDPLNWVSLGGKTAIKQGIAEPLQAALKEATGEAQEATAKKLAKRLTRVYADSSDDLATVANQVFAISQLPDTAKGMTAAFRNPAMNKAAAGVLTNNNRPIFVKALLDAVQDPTMQGVQKALKARNVYQGSEAAQQMLVKAALGSTGIPTVAKGVMSAGKKPVQQIIKHLDEKPGRVASEALLTLANQNQTPLSSQFAKDVAENLSRHNDLGAMDRLGELYKAVEAMHRFAPDDTLYAKDTEIIKKMLDHAKLPLDPASKFLAQKIGPVYKTGYLTNVGFPVRNFVDINVKNANNLGGITAIPEVLGDYGKAIKEVQDYTDVAKRIYDFGAKGYWHKANIPGAVDAPPTIRYANSLTKDLINHYYAANPGEAVSRERFALLTRLFGDESEPLSGLTSELTKMAEPATKNNRMVDILDKMQAEPDQYNAFLSYVQERLDRYSRTAVPAQATAKQKNELLAQRRKLIEETRKRFFSTDGFQVAQRYEADVINGAIGNFYKYGQFIDENPETLTNYLRTRFTIPDTKTLFDLFMEKNPVLQFNEAVERYGRLAEFNEAFEKLGLTYGQAIQLINNTQFNYVNKPYSLRVLETYFPFAGFTLKNARYWGDQIYKTNRFDYSDAIRKMSPARLAEMFEDYKKIPQFDYNLFNKKSGAAEEYYGKLKDFGRKYLGKDTDLTTAKQLGAQVRHFLQAHDKTPDEVLGEIFKRAQRQAPTGGRVIGNVLNTMAPVMNLDQLSNPELYDYDKMQRLGAFNSESQHPYMQPSMSQVYHTLAGNPRFGQQYMNPSDPKQRKVLQQVMKLNPSWLDAFNFALNPAESFASRLYPFLVNPIQYAQAKANGEDPDANDYIIDALPFVGSVYQRNKKTANNVAATESPLQYLSSIFGTQSKYKEYNPQVDNSGASDDLMKYWYARSQAYDWKYTPTAEAQRYPTSRRLTDNTGYQTYESFSQPATAQHSRLVHRRATSRNLYKDLYTAKGVSRMKLRLGKVTAQTLKYRMSDIKYIFRRNWYYLK